VGTYYQSVGSFLQDDCMDEGASCDGTCQLDYLVGVQPSLAIILMDVDFLEVL
jgi:hypothetical protein